MMQFYFFYISETSTEGRERRSYLWAQTNLYPKSLMNEPRAVSIVASAVIVSKGF